MSNKPKIAVSLRNPENGFDPKDVKNKNQMFLNALTKTGAEPIAAMYWKDKSAEKFVQTCDGLLLSGGEDIGDVPERDEFEKRLFELFFEANKPILGICRGLQVIAWALEEELYQHIGEHHRNGSDGVFHKVKVEPNTFLHRILDSDIITVNSTHHQAVKSVPKNFVKAAVSLHPQDEYEIIEAIELVEDDKFIIGVQWHPERLLNNGSEDEKLHAKKLFESFVEACKR